MGVIAVLLVLAPSFRPFEFAFQSDDGLGTIQHRREQGDDDGTVRGTYGFMDAFGLYRVVAYVADVNGFRATVKSNEPGTANQNTADVLWYVQPPPNNIQTTIRTQHLAKSNPIRARNQDANITLAASESSSKTLYSERVPPTAPKSPYPVLERMNRVVGVHLPSQDAEERSKITPPSSETL